MTNSSIPVAHSATEMRDLKWSAQEKAVARRAFNLALGRELDSVVRKAKEKAERIKEASELWDLENWLTLRRLQIDRIYDYRYSVLPEVFAYLLHEGRLTEDDLVGLGPDKLEFIRRYRSFLKAG